MRDRSGEVRGRSSRPSPSAVQVPSPPNDREHDVALADVVNDHVRQVLAGRQRRDVDEHVVAAERLWRRPTTIGVASCRYVPMAGSTCPRGDQRAAVAVEQRPCRGEARTRGRTVAKVALAVTVGLWATELREDPEVPAKRPEKLKVQRHDGYGYGRLALAMRRTGDRWRELVAHLPLPRVLTVVMLATSVGAALAGAHLERSGYLATHPFTNKALSSLMAGQSACCRSPA